VISTRWFAYPNQGCSHFLMYSFTNMKIPGLS
jgi:hypothetical protein